MSILLRSDPWAAGLLFRMLTRWTLCRIAWWLGVPAALLLGTGVMWGPVAAGLGLVQALLAIIVLEDVNYIEHYGLQRALTRTGRRAASTLQPSVELSASSVTCTASAKRNAARLIPVSGLAALPAWGRRCCVNLGIWAASCD